VECIRRRKTLAMAIAHGEISYEGPVRKFLRVMPIMRRLNFDSWTGVRGSGAAPAATH
jgi:hypothetical protein